MIVFFKIPLKCQLLKKKIPFLCVYTHNKIQYNRLQPITIIKIEHLLQLAVVTRITYRL